MSTMSSEYVHSENDSDNDLESLGSLSDGEDAEKTESFTPKLYTLSKPEEQSLYSMVRENQRSKNAYKENQAISDDYSETGYDRAHLNPNSFQCSEGRRSTFTLTNAAPMDACFNRNQWGKWEKTEDFFKRQAQK
ncbi:endonuclease domain-containing 1 -like protein [Labeo rohita]|uniref:Endonuclease domain-containing 1-like protein n=1 Tax=Labeo rohita TaxID=84645 RepID=A0A498MMI6_LABRO|nr:endonuclease domain-containing 1 -like protein [Labeo rohita]